MRRQIGRRDPKRGSKVDGGAAAEAVAAACQPVVMAMLMERRLLVVGMLLGAGLVVSTVRMKRSVDIAADESERQQQDQAAQEQGSLHGTSAEIAQGRLEVKSGSVSTSAGGPGGIGSQ